VSAEPLPQETWFATAVLRPLRGRRGVPLTPRVLLDNVDNTGIWLWVLPARTPVLVRLQLGVGVNAPDLLWFTTRIGSHRPVIRCSVPTLSRNAKDVLNTITATAVQILDEAEASIQATLDAG